MGEKRPLRLYCFSPPVMVATFVIETALAAYVIYRYKMNRISRAIVAMLLCLGAFQLAEYYVCTQSTAAITASRLGYVAITFLPTLGLYLMSQITQPFRRYVNYLIFVLTACIAAYFLFAQGAFDAYECTGNYVIFQIGEIPARLYGVFYFGTIMFTLVKGALFLSKKPKAKTASAIKWLMIGYALFIVPVAILTVLHPDTSQAIPSVLCGFAITIALVLGLQVASLTLNKRKRG